MVANCGRIRPHMSVTLTAARPALRGTMVVLWLVGIVGILFISVAALPYFTLSETRFGDYWPRRWWLLAHISTGIVALLTGPVQLWLGLSDRRMAVHRRVGVAYMAAVAISAVAGYYLASNTDGGWVFGFGLAGLATAWVITTSLAFVAIKRQLFEQHKEWMIRSYVVTTGFVSFRALTILLAAMQVGTAQEQIAAASWFCWAVPLVLTEAVLQGRKILTVP